MRKIFVFLMALVGLGMMLGGCVSPIGTTKIPAAPVIKNYINPLKPKKSQVVGNKNIKFYVGKVVDSRKIKRLVAKRNWLLPFIVQGKITMNGEKAFIKVAKVTLTKALTDVGWGVINSPKKTNYIVNMDIINMGLKTGLLYGHRAVITKICILGQSNKIVLKKKVEYSNPVLFELYTKGGVNMAGIPFKELYQELVKFFSSPEFVNAVEHKSVVFDNSSNSKPLSN